MNASRHSGLPAQIEAEHPLPSANQSGGFIGLQYGNVEPVAKAKPSFVVRYDRVGLAGSRQSDELIAVSGPRKLVVAVRDRFSPADPRSDQAFAFVRPQGLRETLPILDEYDWIDQQRRPAGNDGVEHSTAGGVRRPCRDDEDFRVDDQPGRRGGVRVRRLLRFGRGRPFPELNGTSPP